MSERFKVHLLPLPDGSARPRDDASARHLVAKASEAGHDLLFWCTTEEDHGAA